MYDFDDALEFNGIGRMLGNVEVIFCKKNNDDSKKLGITMLLKKTVVC